MADRMVNSNLEQAVDMFEVFTVQVFYAEEYSVVYLHAIEQYIKQFTECFKL